MLAMCTRRLSVHAASVPRHWEKLGGCCLAFDDTLTLTRTRARCFGTVFLAKCA